MYRFLIFFIATTFALTSCINVKNSDYTVSSEYTQSYNPPKMGPHTVWPLPYNLYLTPDPIDVQKMVIATKLTDQKYVRVCSPDSVVYIDLDTTYQNKLRSELLRNTNNYRKKIKLNPYTYQEQLIPACDMHVTYISALPTYIGHSQHIDLPGFIEYSTLTSRLKQTGMCWPPAECGITESSTMVSENVAISNSNDDVIYTPEYYAKRFISLWMKSSVHRANVLSKMHGSTDCSIKIRQVYWSYKGQQHCLTSAYVVALYK